MRESRDKVEDVKLDHQDRRLGRRLNGLRFSPANMKLKDRYWPMVNR